MKKQLFVAFLGGLLGTAVTVFLFGWTYTYDTTTPAGTDTIASVDDRIRELKAGVQERLNVDHAFQLTSTQVSDANVGEHRRVTLINNQSATAAADLGIVHVKDVDSRGELFFLEEEGNDIQLTSKGMSTFGHTQTAKTAAYTITTAELENNITFTNTGAAAIVPYTWPALAAGQRTSFVVTDTDGIKIIPPTGGQFYMVNIGASTASKYIQSTTIGACLDLESDGTYIYIVNIGGVWDIES